MGSQDESYASIKKRLDDAGVKSAVVADNLFDAPSVSELSDEIPYFLNEVEREDDFFTGLHEVGIGTAEAGEVTAEDIDEKAIATLWSKRDDGSSISKIAKDYLFPQVLQDFGSLTSIVNSLEHLGLKVTRIGNEQELYGEFEPMDLVFLDYYWGAVSDSDSPRRAGVIAREIYHRHDATQEKPFIVLMSSQPEVKNSAEQFRTDSDLLGGLFDFVLREELTNQGVLAFKLATWAAGMATRHKIQDFVETLGNTVRSKSDTFIQKVRSLTIEDYAYVQAISLQPDGHPLGDYMLWLFGSLLVNSVLESNEALAEKRKMLDELSFDSFLPSQRPPSTYLAEIYGLAVAEPTYGDIETHPLDDATEPEKRLPVLRFGDLFIKDADSTIYMVATPDCDLAFAPDSGRKLEDDLSVILIPGRLNSLSQNKTHSHFRTDLFHYKGGQYRIFWEPKKVISKPVCQIRSWCKDCNYSRFARIRTPYAIRIQQEFTSDLGRVGTPVSPPVFEQVEVQLYCEGLGAPSQMLGEPEVSGATVMHTRDDRTFVLISIEYAQKLQERITAVIEIYKDHQEKFKTDNPTRSKRYLNKIKRVWEFQNDPERLLSLVEKRWPIPDLEESIVLIPDTIGLHRNGVFNNGCRAGHLICLNILY